MLLEQLAVAVPGAARTAADCDACRDGAVPPATLLGTVASLAACVELGTAAQACRAVCWQRAPGNASLAHQCLCRRDQAWLPHPANGTDSVQLARPCATAADCAYNGQCVSQRCQCRSGWGGPFCAELQLLAVNASQLGYRSVNVSGNISSWGAPILYDQGLWHGWASEMLDNCGINSWETNSQVARRSKRA